ncbi:NADPH-dependent F420 reductase [Micromonospora azadirachtae]|uniref:NADPH-dependent F420 reductase n=1 Tax=Micromonospora azadirachtae TaxID=1970735 RepID=A0ABW2ZUS9_9ACTN
MTRSTGTWRSANMATIGFIGAGHIGSTVARLAVAAGYDVVLSNSRGPETLNELVEELGPRARAATPAEAAAAAELVVVAFRSKAYRQLPVEPLAGKPVIDTNNYVPEFDGSIPEFESGTTVSALVQQHLHSAHVVKAFSNIYFQHLASLSRPAGSPDRSAVAIAGNDANAKAAVTAFLDRIGYDTVDIGPLAEDWRLRPGTPAYGVPYGDGRPDFWASGPEPVNAQQLRNAVTAADAQLGDRAGKLPEGYDHGSGAVAATEQ